VTITGTDDAELLRAIAQDASEEALSALLVRFEAPATGLALQITGNATLAAEGVQAAFIRIWRKAAVFDPACGMARNWILKIVARECLLVLRTERKNRSARLRAASQPLKAVPAAPGGVLETRELLAALRQHLHLLPEIERQAVALYYAGGLSQDEIARELNLPQRTISFRLKKALDSLRQSLTAAGFAAAAPLLCQQGLREAICQGSDGAVSAAPLLARVLDGAAKHSLRKSLPVAKGISWWLSAALLCTVAAVGIFVVTGTEEPRAMAPVRAPAVVPEIPQPPRTAHLLEEKPYEPPVRWSFERGVPEAFRPETADSWLADHGALGFSAEKIGRLYLPIMKLPEAVEVLVTVSTPPESMEAFRFGFEMRQQDVPLRARIWKEAPKVEEVAPFVREVWRVAWVDGHLSFDNRLLLAVYEFEQSSGPVRLVLGVKNLLLHAVEVRALQPEEALKQREFLRKLKSETPEPNWKN